MSKRDHLHMRRKHKMFNPDVFAITLKTGAIQHHAVSRVCESVYVSVIALIWLKGHVELIYGSFTF